MHGTLGIRSILDRNPCMGPRRAGNKRFWTTREERILRERYPDGGVAACLPLLPGRSAAAIYAHAQLRGIKARLPAGYTSRRQKYPASEHVDRLIRQTYQATPTLGDIKRLAATLGRPRNWVSRRARTLGLVAPRFKEPPWTKREEEIAAELAHRRAQFIRKRLAREGFVRSETAIVVKLKRLGVSRADDPDHYTARGLAGIMGVDAKTVTRWIDKGWLKARHKGTARSDAQGGDCWWIHRRAVRSFIVGHTAHVDIRKCDKFWLVELLANGGVAS